MQCSCYSVTDVSWTRSQIKPFPLQLPLSELFYHSNGKWAKMQGLWGSSLSPLYWLSYLHSPHDFYECYQKLARPRRWSWDEDFPHLHLCPTSCPLHPFCSAEAASQRKRSRRNKNIPGSWSPIEGHTQPWPVSTPSWFLFSLEESLCWVPSSQATLSSVLGLSGAQTQNKQCCASY